MVVTVSVAKPLNELSEQALISNARLIRNPLLNKGLFQPLKVTAISLLIILIKWRSMRISSDFFVDSFFSGILSIVGQDINCVEILQLQE